MGTYTPQLLPVIGVFFMLSLATLLLLATAAGIRKPGKLFNLAGSTTLGCYVIHMYFTFPLSILQRNFASIPSPDCKYEPCPGAVTLQMLFVLATPLVFQLTIGVLFHKLLMLQFKGIFAAASRTHALCSRFVGRHPDRSALVIPTLTKPARSSIELPVVHRGLSAKSSPSACRYTVREDAAVSAPPDAADRAPTELPEEFDQGSHVVSSTHAGSSLAHSQAPPPRDVPAPAQPRAVGVKTQQV